MKGKSLQIWWDRRLVGRFFEDDAGIALVYDPAWIAGAGAPISMSLPLQLEPIRASAVAWFIGNLLPEGQARESLNAQYRLDSTDDFGLLEYIGAECAGALSILPERERPVPDDATFDALYEPAMDAYELGQLIQSFASSSTANYKGHRLRLSLAGVQRKFTLARFDDALHRSYGGATTHVVKPDVAVALGTRPPYPGVVFNEYFCARLARACQLDVADAELLPYVLYRDGPPQYAYMTRRYDRRVPARGRVERLHQEDFCQALGRDRRRKYEEDRTGVTLADLFAFVRDAGHVSVPAVAQRQLLNGLLFNVLIGNGDAHAKNYALLREEKRLRIAPLYDLLCTQAYPDLNNHFAQRIGRATRFAELRRSDLDLLEASLGIRVRAIAAAARRLCDALLRQLPNVRRELEQHPAWDLAREIVERVIRIATGRAIHLLRVIDDGAAPGAFTEISTPILGGHERSTRALCLLAENGGRFSPAERGGEFADLREEDVTILQDAFDHDHVNPFRSA